VTGIYPNRDAWIVLAIIAAVALLYVCTRVSR
jgi:hypothetical protein